MSQELWPSDGSVIADVQLSKRSWFLWEEKFSGSAQFTFIVHLTVSLNHKKTEIKAEVFKTC